MDHIIWATRVSSLTHYSAYCRDLEVSVISSDQVEIYLAFRGTDLPLNTRKTYILKLQYAGDYAFVAIFQSKPQGTFTCFNKVYAMLDLKLMLTRRRFYLRLEDITDIT